MLRFLLCAASVFVLVLSFCLLPQTAAARRCPVKEPETLLSLYQNSDAIYVAAFDKIEPGEVVENNDDYTVSELKKHFTVSSTLKGESRKFFVLEDREYTYKIAEPGPIAESPVVEEPAEVEKSVVTEEPAEPVEEEEETEPNLKSGDTVLLFVKNGEGEEGQPTLTDYRDGVKKLSTHDLGVYEARIDELNSIFADKKVSASRLMEWLIRCAEDPATRWEGTFELLRSVQGQEWLEQAAERRRERIANGEPVEVEPTETEAPDGDAAEAEPRKNFDTGVFAKLIDPNQKQALANLILNGDDASSKTEKTAAVKGDRELIELLKRWGDPRLIAFLLDHLRAASDDESGSNADTMRMIAELLKDDDAAVIAGKYSDVAYEDGEDVVGLSSDVDDDSEEPAVDAAEQSTTAEPETANSENKENAPDAVETAKKPEAKKITAKELRTGLFQTFLSRCDRVIADRQGDTRKETETNSAR